MPLTITGNPGNVTTPLSASITAFANNGSGAIRATTAAPHLFGSNDRVRIAVSLFAPAVFSITVIDATHFDLVGSTYSATSTGVATDLSLTPQIQFPTDGDSFSQQLSGALSASQALCDRSQYLAEQISVSVAPIAPSIATPQIAWRSAFAQTSGQDNMAIAWTPIDPSTAANPATQPAAGQYMVLELVPTGGLGLYVTYGQDQGLAAAWSQVGTTISSGLNASLLGACCADGSGNYWIAVTGGSSGPSAALRTYWYNGTSWSSSVLSETAGGNYGGVEMAVLNAYVLVAVMDSGGTPTIYSSNNQYTSKSTFAPTIAAASTNTWYLKSNQNTSPPPPTPQVVAVPNTVGTTPVYSTIDGHTWTTSASLSTLLSGLSIGSASAAGLAFVTDFVGPCWLLALNTTGLGTLFARSTDGVTWTKQLGGLAATKTISDMDAYGNTVVCTLADASSAGPSGQIVSFDGGITWYASPVEFPTNTAASAGYRSRVVAARAPGSFMASNGLWVRPSETFGTGPRL